MLACLLAGADRNKSSKAARPVQVGHPGDRGEVIGQRDYARASYACVRACVFISKPIVRSLALSSQCPPRMRIYIIYIYACMCGFPLRPPSECRPPGQDKHLLLLLLPIIVITPTLAEETERYRFRALVALLNSLNHTRRVQ